MNMLKLESRVVERRTVGGRGFRHALEPSNISTIKSGEGRGGRGGGEAVWRAGWAGWTEGAVGV